MKQIRILVTLLIIVLVSGCTSKTDNNNENNGRENSNQETNISGNNPENKSQTNSDNLEVTEWITGLNTPWAIVFLDEGKTLVSQRNGEIVLIKDGKKQEKIYYKADSLEEGEGGLMGLEKDPDFKTNGYLYAMYTYKDGSDTKNKVVRLKDNGETATLDKVLLDKIPGARFHNGGRIKFGPDKKLYVTTGDAQEPDSAQSLGSVAGKILRMNSDGSIPNDNPIIDSYIYSYGHRNLQGLAFEPNTGDLFASGHGPTGEINDWYTNDRLDYIVAGGNYGRPEVLGNSDDYRNPLILWDDEGNPPAGMSFWYNKLYVTTLKSQKLMEVSLEKEGKEWKVTNINELFEGKYGRLRDAIVGPDGNLYVLTSNKDGRGEPKDGDDKILIFKTK